MAGPVEECIFCERVHRGLCAEDKSKPLPKKRAPKTAPTQGSLPERVASEPSSIGSGPAAGPDVCPWCHPDDKFVCGVCGAKNSSTGSVDRWATVAADRLTPEQAALQALAGIMHPNELEKHGLRRPSRPQINARIAAWKERIHGT